MSGWIELRVKAKKHGGRLKYVQHGIGRTAEEAIKAARVPEGYDIIETEVTRKDIDPAGFEIFHTLDMFRDVDT